MNAILFITYRRSREYMFIPYGELRKAKQYTKDIFYSKFNQFITV